MSALAETKATTTTNTQGDAPKVSKIDAMCAALDKKKEALKAKAAMGEVRH